ncbi:MAG: rod shape-determining protein MreD [Bacteroidia bacterium]|nr:rod shape-determining protein MreD [Bacteroidia bacterium]
MLSNYINIIIRFIVLVLVQVLILNNIELGNYVNPYLYILFIILLPIQTPNILVLSLSFLLGISIDMFSNTPGIHAAACVFIGFARPATLQALAPRDGYDAESIPSIKEMGLGWFLSFSAIMVVLHHIALFFLEIFHFQEFFQTLGRATLSSIFTLVLIIIVQFLFASGRRLK